MLPDPVPRFRGARTTTAHANSIVIVSTWAQDEPIGEVIAASELLPDDLKLSITGRPRGPLAASASRSGRIVVLGYLGDEEYLEMLRSARLIVDLTTRDDCLVCGAYEALAVGRPLLVSDKQALRDLLKDGASYCANEPGAIARAICEALDHESELAHKCELRRETYKAEWGAASSGLVSELSSRALAS